jgi:hypothetical protein
VTLGHTTNGDGPHDPGRCGCSEPPDLGDFVIVLLSGTLAALRDRLLADGFSTAAELVADLAEVTDDYVAQRAG